MQFIHNYLVMENYHPTIQQIYFRFIDMFMFSPKCDYFEINFTNALKLIEELYGDEGKNIFYGKLFGTRKWTLDQFKFILQSGLSLHKKSIIQTICKTQSIEVIQFILENYDIDIEHINLKNILTNWDKFCVFYDLGIPIETFLNNLLTQNYMNADFTKCAKFIYQEIVRNNIYLDGEIMSKILSKYLRLNILELVDVEYLVDRGADARYDNDKNLIVICDYAKENLPLIEYFVDICGCDINIDQSSPLYHAIRRKHTNIIYYLLNKQCIITDSVIEATLYGHLEYVSVLIEYGATIYDFGRICVENLDLPVLKTIRENGGDINELLEMFG